MRGRLASTLALVALCLGAGCAAKSSLTGPSNLVAPPDTPDGLLKGSPEIYVEVAKNRVDVASWTDVHVLVKGNIRHFDTWAGLAICIAGRCQTDVVSIGALRYYKVKLPPMKGLPPDVHSIPVAVGILKIAGTNPLTGLPIYKTKPIVEHRFILQVKHQYVQLRLESPRTDDNSQSGSRSLQTSH